MQNFEFFTPKSMDEALDFMGSGHGDCRIIAGGTDLIPALRSESAHPSHIMNILEIAQLRGILDEGDQVRIGPTTSYTEIVENGLLGQLFPLLVEAASQVGGLLIRNRGTIGGNIGNASPAADVLPVLIALDARLELQSLARGTRNLPAGEAVASPYENRFEADEILTGILLGKLPPGTRSAYEKVARRKAMARSYMSVSLVLGFDAGGMITDARIVPGAVEAVARRVSAAENVLLGSRGEGGPVAIKAAETLVGDVRGVWIPEYKKPVLKAVFLRVLERLL